MTEIIIFTETQETAANWWKEDFLRLSKYGKVKVDRRRLEIITPNCRIQYMRRAARAEGLRADLVWGARKNEAEIFMCKSKYARTDCTIENIRNIVIESFKKEGEKC